MQRLGLTKLNIFAIIRPVSKKQKLTKQFTQK